MLADLDGWTVVFAYPRTGRPGEELPGGGEEAWNAIPGARGCTPELCGVRDNHAPLEALGARVFGLSTQDTGYQREVAERLGLAVSAAVRRAAGPDPRARPAGVRGGRHDPAAAPDPARSATGEIERVAYPVFPPDGAAAQALGLLRAAMAEEG